VATSDSKPNKGFIKELAKSPKPKEKDNKFAWDKAIVKPPSNDAMATPHRIKEFKTVRSAKSNLVSEQKLHISKRRGEK